MKDVTLLTIMHKFLIIQVLKKVVLQVVTYMLLEVKAKVKTTIATTKEQNVKTVVTSIKRMHVGLKIKNVIFAINQVISARYARKDNKVQHKAIHREDSYQNRNPAGLEVNKYMKFKMIICT